MNLIYFIIALFATTLGAISGFGGGVLIKPILDVIGQYDAFVIGVLSSTTVLSMAVVSILKNIKLGFSVDLKLILITIGALIGGIVGKELFELLYFSFTASTIAQIQSGTLVILLIIVLFKNKFKKNNIELPIVSVFAGIVLGALSAFLGIGGGPFNIVFLSILFGFSTKKSVIASIFIIMFSQISNLSSIAITTGFSGYDFSVLLFMIPAAILGGFIGTAIGSKISDKAIDRIYFIITFGLIILNSYNFFAATII